MNRRVCIGMLCSGCVRPTLSDNLDTGASPLDQLDNGSPSSDQLDTASPPCSQDVLLEAPLLDMPIPSTLNVDMPDELLQLLIVRTGEKEWNAVWRICTHGNCDVEWSPQEEVVVCPCHNSIFSVEGLVLEGPATRDLRFFPICYDEENQQFYIQT